MVRNNEPHTHEIDHTPCPYCGHNRRCATGLDGQRRPKAGDYTVCAKCGSVSVFDEQLMLRPPSPQQTQYLIENPQMLQRIMHASRVIKLRNKARRLPN